MNHKKTGGICILLGIGLILAAAGWTLYNIWDSFRAEQSVRASLVVIAEEMPQSVALPEDLTWNQVLTLPADDQRLEGVEIPYYVANPDVGMLEMEIDGRNYIGIVEIPALELEIPILSQWSQSGAKVAPCRYFGSVYQKNMVIAGHNYASHFGGLPQLGIGEAVYVTDMEGNRFAYEVIGMEILQPEQIEQMRDGDWDLTLFTCTIGGQSRVTIRCRMTQ